MYNGRVSPVGIESAAVILATGAGAVILATLGTGSGAVILTLATGAGAVTEARGTCVTLTDAKPVAMGRSFFVYYPGG